MANATKTKKKTTKKVVKKVKKKVVKKTEKKAQRETVRVRALGAIAKKNMSAGQVKESIGLSHGLKPTLDGEVERGHLKHGPSEGENGVIYTITATGKKALKDGTVNPVRGE